MSFLFNKPLKFPLDGKDRVAIKCATTGKILNAEIGAFSSQLFDLSELGKLCMKYPDVIITDCETGQEITLPLQIVQVLLMHEKCICEMKAQILILQGGNAPPVVNVPETVTITLPTNSTSVTAVANDADGTIASYQWVQISGNADAVIDEPTNVDTAFNNLSEGTYVFQVTVTDDDGATATDTVTIIVNPIVVVENNPPVSNAGLDQSVDANNVSLSGSGSTDSDGTITDYLWTQISGNANAIITTPNSINTTITNLAQGSYVFQLEVTDNDGATDTDLITIQVTAEQPVSQALIITLADCFITTLPVQNETVYIEELPSVLANQLVNIDDGDIIYTDSALTIPFNGGGNNYTYQGIGTNQVDKESFVVSTTGVISAHEICPIPLFSSLTFDYNGSDQSQGNATPNGSLRPFTLAEITGMYTGANPIQGIRMFTEPTIGDVGLQDELFEVSEDVIASQIENNLGFYCRGLIDGVGNAQNNNGSFTTTFKYGIVDNTNTVIDVVIMTLNANEQLYPTYNSDRFVNTTEVSTNVVPTGTNRLKTTNFNLNVNPALVLDKTIELDFELKSIGFLSSASGESDVRIKIIKNGVEAYNQLRQITTVGTPQTITDVFNSFNIEANDVVTIVFEQHINISGSTNSRAEILITSSSYTDNIGNVTNGTGQTRLLDEQD